ncbi:MAG: COX15/CtaA family protein [Granulosicoccaceae bacterium]|jgi:cytochrome c oxidase assembly protein subunit 15
MTGSTMNTQRDDRQLAIWLLLVCALIFAMVVLGGVTRLTHSGLSMVDWHPIHGILPPMNEAEWLEEFEQYKQSPEYLKINQHKGMGVEEFKSIFWFEYWHRILGRIIGLAFLLPFLYFLARGKIRQPMVPRFVIMFALGGLQGLLGWYMVKSGLVDKPSVSQYRLTAHLLAAVTIYVFILWHALGLWTSHQIPVSDTRAHGLKKHGLFVTGLIILMIMSGGFVAGTRAGYTFNDFPFMHGSLLPPGGMALEPWWLNFFENLATVQFTHRVLAIVVMLAITAYVIRGWRNPALASGTRSVFTLLFAMLIIQLTLGITTLIYVVPVHLGASHQAGALLLLTLAVISNHRLRAH